MNIDEYIQHEVFCYRASQFFKLSSGLLVTLFIVWGLCVFLSFIPLTNTIAKIVDKLSNVSFAALIVCTIIYASIIICFTLFCIIANLFVSDD